MARPKRAPGELSPRLTELMALADGTRTRPEIARAMGITLKHLSVVMSAARAKGLNPQFLAMPFSGGRPKAGCKPAPGAALPRISLDLPPNVARWFVAQIPQGGTADDLVRGFIVDAFNEEVGQ